MTQLGLGGPATSAAVDIQRQVDGRLVVVGSAFDALGRKAITLARYLSTGSFDPSFGPGGSGVVMEALGAGPAPSVQVFDHALAFAPDGAIVVCGEATDASGSFGVLIARFTSDGVLDPSFASGGKFTMQLNASSGAGSSQLLGCAVQPNGDVLGVGLRTSSTGGLEAVALRLDDHGTLDPGFGSGGVFAHQLSLSSTQLSDASDVIVLPNGSLALSIEGRDASDHNAMGVAELGANGQLTPGFGTGGFTLLAIGGNAFGPRLGRQADGHLVVGGGASDPMGHVGMLATRFTASGALDPSFGQGGHALVQPSAAATPQSETLGLVVEPSGKLLLIGDAADTLGDTQLAIARFTADGALDASFGTNGIVLQQFSGGPGAQTYATGGVFTPDGKLVVSGYTVAGAVSTWFVAAFLADLPPTASFSVTPATPTLGDTVTLNASASADPDGRVTAIAWDLDGDGAYGDATGTTASTSFTSGGNHVVGVAVTDDDGVTSTTTMEVMVACGSAVTFASVDCRLAELIAEVTAGVPAGKTRDHAATALATARQSLAAAAAESGRVARKALAKARHAVGAFLGTVHAKDVPRGLRRQLVSNAKGVRTTIGKLARRTQ